MANALIARAALPRKHFSNNSDDINAAPVWRCDAVYPAGCDAVGPDELAYAFAPCPEDSDIAGSASVVRPIDHVSTDETAAQGVIPYGHAQQIDCRSESFPVKTYRHGSVYLDARPLELNRSDRSIPFDSAACGPVFSGVEIFEARALLSRLACDPAFSLDLYRDADILEFDEYEQVLPIGRAPSQYVDRSALLRKLAAVGLLDLPPASAATAEIAPEPRLRTPPR